ncbi:hypothetical protein CEXT_212381, partial [Caerostris extrusa]
IISLSSGKKREDLLLNSSRHISSACQTFNMGLVGIQRLQIFEEDSKILEWIFFSSFLCINHSSLPLRQHINDLRTFYI